MRWAREGFRRGQVSTAETADLGGIWVDIEDVVDLLEGVVTGGGGGRGHVIT